MNPEDYTYSEHLKRLGDHAEANAKPCHFCKDDHVESNLTKIKATQDLICWGCQTSMTLAQARDYLKGSEPTCDPRILCDFINQLWPHNKPEGYQKEL